MKKKRGCYLRRKTIEHLEKDLIEKKSVEKDKRQVAERLFQEAFEKLKKTVYAKDFVEISLTQSMIEAFSQKMLEEHKAAREVNLIQSRVNKRKSFIISVYFAKRNKLSGVFCTGVFCTLMQIKSI